ncbi:MAG: hypothetical protein AVDCRST_MAG70-1609, partial [uncultured Thermomicrobiales bacterium]
WAPSIRLVVKWWPRRSGSCERRRCAPRSLSSHRVAVTPSTAIDAVITPN